jgi:hypothetical protein
MKLAEHVALLLENRKGRDHLEEGNIRMDLREVE